MTASTIREIKNVKRLRFSSQIEDFVLFAKQSGRKVVIEVRQNTKLAKEIVRREKAGDLIIKKTLPRR